MSNNMNALEMLISYKELVDEYLGNFFENEKITLEEIDYDSANIIDPLNDFTKGGKRIRAALMYCGYSLFSDEYLKDVIEASISFELLQSYLLIHDDIIDKDELRRGKDTVHIVYEKIHKKYFNEDPTECKEHGTTMAILTGDLANHLALQIVQNIDMENINSKYILKAAREFNSIGPSTLIGEYLDILSTKKEMITKKELLKLHELKTAVYTFEKPLLIGAILAGAEKEQLEYISDFAIPLGIAFQLQDDILGIYGNKEKLGKSTCTDIKENKKTLLMIKTLEYADETQKNILKSALGNNNLTKAEFEKVKQTIIDTEALKYSEDLIKTLIDKSKSALETIDGAENIKYFLSQFSDYMSQREY